MIASAKAASKTSRLLKKARNRDCGLCVSLSSADIQRPPKSFAVYVSRSYVPDHPLHPYIRAHFFRVQYKRNTPEATREPPKTTPTRGEGPMPVKIAPIMKSHNKMAPADIAPPIRR